MSKRVYYKVKKPGLYGSVPDTYVGLMGRLKYPTTHESFNYSGFPRVLVFGDGREDGFYDDELERVRMPYEDELEDITLLYDEE